MKYLSLTFFSILAFSFSPLTFVHESPSKGNSRGLVSNALKGTHNTFIIHSTEAAQMVPNVSLVIEEIETKKFFNPL